MAVSDLLDMLAEEGAGALDTARVVGGNALLSPVAGLYGFGSGMAAHLRALRNGKGLRRSAAEGWDTAANTINDTMELGPAPRTVAGVKNLQAIGNIVDALRNAPGVKQVADKAVEATDWIGEQSPALGAAIVGAANVASPGGKVKSATSKLANITLKDIDSMSPGKLRKLLLQHGKPVSPQDAQRLFGDGYVLFGAHEMDELPFRLKTPSDVDLYSDDLLALPPPPASAPSKASNSKTAVGNLIDAADEANLALTDSDVARNGEKLTKAQREKQEFLSKLGNTSERQETVIQKEADKILPKLIPGKRTEEELRNAARTEALRKLRWNKYDKPNMEQVYGTLDRSRYDDPMPVRKRNTPDVVQQRAQKAEEFLSQPTEPWVAREYAFPRASIRDALEGFPDVSQTRFQRYQPTERSDLSYIDEAYTDPRNRSLIKAQILRGLPLGGQTFYASYWPVVQEAEARGVPRAQIERWIEGVAPGSARNSIINENAVGNMLFNMNARGVPLTKENVAREMDQFRREFGVGLPLMDVHRIGVADVIEGGQSLRAKLLRDQTKAKDATEYKIPTYGVQKAGDFRHSWVGDTHEAAGETIGSRYHPYFAEAGGFNPAEYGRAESHMLDIAKELGIPGGMAQAGRWFGGGELTGLRSPRGDALDILEKQVAYTMKNRGLEVSPQSVRDYTIKLIREGGVLLPWFKKTDMPDYRY